MRTLFFVGGFVVGMLAACKEPMSDDPGYKADVLCNNTMKAQGGARNELKALCTTLVGDRFRAQPQGNHEALAACILKAADEKAARECK